MRAVVINEVRKRDTVRIEEVDPPRAGPGEVVVEVRACGVNYTDLLSLDGKYQNNPPPPFTPGKDAAGVVIEAGPGVARLAPGDRVIAHVTWGAMAEQVACPEARCFSIPASLSFEAAAALGLVQLTAYFALKVRGGLRQGETVLVNGASGGVGLALVGMARALGAAKVLAGVVTPAKAPAVLEAGADAVIDLSAGGDELRPAVKAQIDDHTGGIGVDLVVDLLGGEYFEATLRVLATYGRILVTGFASGTIPTARTNYLLLKNISVVGMTLQTFLDEHSPELAVAQSTIFDLVAAGKLTPNITSRFPLERFMEAIALLEERKIIGKAVLNVGPSASPPSVSAHGSDERKA